nr:FecR family protein [uncultured Cohaesibacter sp.]
MRLKSGRVLFPGQTLTTASRTRLQLVHGKQRIQVGSNTVLSLPALDETEPGHTKIYQMSGTTHLEVDKRDVKHFSVVTPYMVAAVKGTQFTVAIEGGHADVRVHEGLVEVSSKLSSDVFNVAAGQAISMNTNRLQGGETKPIKMAFLDRGEELPAASGNARFSGPNAFSDIMGMIGSMFGAVMLYLSGLIDASIYYVTGTVTGFVVPLAQKVQSQGIMPYVLMALASVIVIVAIVAFILYRRRRRRINTPTIRLQKS